MSNNHRKIRFALLLENPDALWGYGTMFSRWPCKCRSTIFLAILLVWSENAVAHGTHTFGTPFEILEKHFVVSGSLRPLQRQRSKWAGPSGAIESPMAHRTRPRSLRRLNWTVCATRTDFVVLVSFFFAVNKVRDLDRNGTVPFDPASTENSVIVFFYNPTEDISKVHCSIFGLQCFF